MRRFRGADLSLGLLAVAVNIALVAVVVLVAGRSSADTPSPTPTAVGTPPASSPVSAPTTTSPATVASATPGAPISRLAVTTAPASLAVLGDGTGDEEGEWVSALGELLGRDHRVSVRGLDASDPTRYAETVTYGRSGPAFSIWNASRRGAQADYAVSRLPFMVPARPDAVLLSYGREDAAAEIAARLDAPLRALRVRWPGLAVAVVLQAPERGDTRRDVREAAAAWARSRALPTIDVAAAFNAGGSPDRFVSILDPTSVNERGGRLWGATVYRALGGTVDDPAPVVVTEEAPPTEESADAAPVRPRRPRPGHAATPTPHAPTTGPEPTAATPTAPTTPTSPGMPTEPTSTATPSAPPSTPPDPEPSTTEPPPAMPGATP